MTDPLRTLSENEQKIKQITRIMDKVDMEHYYHTNFYSVLYRQSHPFLTDLETFLDQCARERKDLENDNLESYIVIFTNGNMMHFIGEDEEHAREQAKDAEPDLEIESVKHEWS